MITIILIFWINRIIVDQLRTEAKIQVEYLAKSYSRAINSSNEEDIKFIMDILLPSINFPIIITSNNEISSGSATFNVSPSTFGIYLNKIGCFCFEKQTLQPGEKKEFVLTFFLDPKVVDDNKTKNMSDVTLSFTFFSSGYYEKSNT